MKMVRKVRRMRDHPTPEGPGRTLCFMTPNGCKRSPTRFFEVDQVPDFEGEEAWFEVEPCRGLVWMTWKFIRQVDEAGRPLPVPGSRR